jgi:hypothetical protein
MKTYEHIVDAAGEHWLRDNAGNYFNGTSWIPGQGLSLTQVYIIGECSVPDFLQVLETVLNYRNAL